MLMTPFHTMALIAPRATEADIDPARDIDLAREAFGETVAPLLGRA
jgi:hypothetical protein